MQLFQNGENHRSRGESKSSVRSLKSSGRERVDLREININLLTANNGGGGISIEKYEHSRAELPFVVRLRGNCEMRKEHFMAVSFLHVRMYATRSVPLPWETWHELAPKPEKLFRDRR